MSVPNGMESPVVDRFVQKSRALLRSPKLMLRESGSSSFQWTPWMIVGVVLGSLFVVTALWVLYRYMIWKPRMKARRAGGPVVSPSSKTTGESSSAEASPDETRRLFAAIKAK